jgi:hypothetical protein
LGAAVLPAGAPLHGRLELDGDIDVFALSYPVGTVLQFDTPADKFIVNASPVSRSLLVTKTPMPVEVAGARGPYDIAVSFMGTDPGGNSEKPVAVPLPADIYGGFEFPGDDDAFLFQGLAGHVYRATITPSSSLLISDLRGRVAYGTGTLHFVPSIDTTIKVNVSADQAFAYQLSISDVGVDDHPDTPSAPLATITPGTPVQGQFDWADDLDFVVANVVPGRFYEGRCTTPNCWVRGTTLDNSGSDYCVQATGTELMLAVSRAGSGNGFMPGPWSLEFQDRGADDHSESEAQATVVPFDSSTTALLSCRRDVDTFTFSAAPRQLTTLRASCDGCTVDIRSMAAQYVTALDGGLTATIGGSTSPIIVSFSTSQPTALSFTISDGGFDDYGNTLVTSTVVDAGTTISGELQFRGDVDAFAFDLAAGGHLFELVGPAVAAQLWRSSGYVTSLSTSDMQFVAPTAERYYLLLNGTGAYELIVQ